MREATQAQKNKLVELGVEFKDGISFDEARDLLRSSMTDVPKVNLKTKPELYDSLIARSEEDGVKYVDGVKYLP